MGLLKKLQKNGQKQKIASHKDVLGIIPQITKLTEMGLIKLETNCDLHHYQALHAGKSKAFVNSWYKNILTGWFVMYEQKYSVTKSMQIFSLDEADRLLGTYTIKDGFKAAA